MAVLGVQALAAVAVVSLHRSETWLRRALPYIISVAVGVLLATGAAHLLPEAVEALGNRSAVWVVLVATMLALYAFERIFQVFSGVRAEPLGVGAKPVDEADHEHEAAQLFKPVEPVAPEHDLSGHHHHHHGATKPATLLLGSLTHSLVDGTSVAAAFSIDARVGWVTALAVGLHEVPHRLGDFALLVHMGIKRGPAALLAIGAGGLSLLGWAIVMALGEHGSHRVAWLLPVSAGSFLYISLVDLLPELQSERRPAAVLWQIVCLAAGVVLALSLTHMRGA
jgi:zinc and cadmium transporter